MDHDQGRSVFRSLPADRFPFTIEMFATSSGELVHSITVDSPGVLKVPPLADKHGPARTRITFADGEIVEQEP